MKRANIRGGRKNQGTASLYSIQSSQHRPWNALLTETVSGRCVTRRILTLYFYILFTGSCFSLRRTVVLGRHDRKHDRTCKREEDSADTADGRRPALPLRKRRGWEPCGQTGGEGTLQPMWPAGRRAEVTDQVRGYCLFRRRSCEMNKCREGGPRLPFRDAAGVQPRLQTVSARWLLSLCCLRCQHRASCVCVIPPAPM